MPTELDYLFKRYLEIFQDEGRFGDGRNEIAKFPWLFERRRNKINIGNRYTGSSEDSSPLFAGRFYCRKGKNYCLILKPETPAQGMTTGKVVEILDKLGVAHVEINQDWIDCISDSGYHLSASVQTLVHYRAPGWESLENELGYHLGSPEKFVNYQCDASDYQHTGNYRYRLAEDFCRIEYTRMTSSGLNSTLGISQFLKILTRIQQGRTSTSELNGGNFCLDDIIKITKLIGYSGFSASVPSVRPTVREGASSRTGFDFNSAWTRAETATPPEPTLVEHRVAIPHADQASFRYERFNTARRETPSERLRRVRAEMEALNTQASRVSGLMSREAASIAQNMSAVTRPTPERLTDIYTRMLEDASRTVPDDGYLEWVNTMPLPTTQPPPTQPSYNVQF